MFLLLPLLLVLLLLLAVVLLVVVATLVAVAGENAQCVMSGDRGVEKASRSLAPWVDVVFGTHNIGSLPALLERARHNEEAAIEIVESLETFPSNLIANSFNFAAAVLFEIEDDAQKEAPKVSFG